MHRTNRLEHPSWHEVRGPGRRSNLLRSTRCASSAIGSSASGPDGPGGAATTGVSTHKAHTAASMASRNRFNITPLLPESIHEGDRLGISGEHLFQAPELGFPPIARKHVLDPKPLTVADREEDRGAARPEAGTRRGSE